MPEKASGNITYENVQPVCSEGILIENIDREYQKFAINCYNQTDFEGYVNFPLLYYKGYGVKASDMEEEIRVEENDFGCLRIVLPEGFSGNVIVDYF